ncbi:general secretion pathway protein N [Nitrobacter vulgaris]|uniref:hypothetical protein n=1 Tax=Nitrobacter vulgaris TaxID=29421 RepID=UPI002862D049|nr:hypothetical protein [Nitrobacter vulgaris]MDR6305015.1 general secretion pathway protein N [Nitrobacter vulgaris]
MTSPRKIAVILTLLLLGFGIPASTRALQSDVDDIDLDKPRRDNASSARSLWDQPAPSAPTVVRPPPPPQATEERTPSANPLWAIPLATLTHTRQRPVFSQTRRPARAAVASPADAKAKAPPPPPRAESPQLSLVGTVVGEDTSLGVFINSETRASLRLKIGDDFQGWKLRSVQGRKVTLTHGDQSAILSLPQPGTIKASAQPPANAAAATTKARADNQPRSQPTSPR